MSFTFLGSLVAHINCQYFLDIGLMDLIASVQAGLLGQISFVLFDTCLNISP